jgi:CBS domain-containing protein
MLESATEPLALTLRQVMKRPPVACLPGEPVRRAIQTMRDLSVGSMVVVDPHRVPIGILTLRDIADRVVLESGAVDGPIERVMTANPVSLPVSETAYRAALTMIRHGVRHIVLVESGQLAGIVSERDLFGLQSSNVRELSAAIKGAGDLDAIERFGRDISELARKMFEQGVAVGVLTAFIAALNDLLTERVVQLEFASSPLENLRCCWILMGSEGRSEQTLATDQDNGIVFAVPSGRSTESVRAALLPVAERINRALDRAGYRWCRGEIMACNPRWTLSLDEWRHRFESWIDSGSPEALLHAAIFFDLRPLQGDLSLAQELRQWLLQHAPRNPRFLHQMTRNALKNRPPLGRFRRFRTADDGRLDLKVNGATMFVDAARIFSLARGIDEVNTERRLRAAVPALNLPLQEAEAWIAAYYQVQALRLRHQAERLGRGLAPDNRVDPRALHEFDKRVLAVAFGQARAVQDRLAADYQI